jgi:hypothetical protein
MNQVRDVVIAILCKDKEHCLPIYLHTIENLDYPKNNIILYIRTNDNNDNSEEILSDWISEVRDLYKEIVFDSTNLDEKLKTYSRNDWNAHRFSILGKIRQESVDFAIKRGANYFVVDCDNFCTPRVLKDMFESNLPVVGPFLTKSSFYSNYHDKVDENGYMKQNTEGYIIIFWRKLKGLIQVDVIHCTYFIRHDILPIVSYDDGSGRYEYVIFSDVLRKNCIPQYIDNRQEMEVWITEFFDPSTGEMAVRIPLIQPSSQETVTKEETDDEINESVVHDELNENTDNVNNENIRENETKNDNIDDSSNFDDRSSSGDEDSEETDIQAVRLRIVDEI